jgi:homoaconitate hydratase
MYGSLSGLEIAVLRTDAVGIQAIEKSRFHIYSIAKVNLTGVLPPGVTGKDVFVAFEGRRA